MKNSKYILLLIILLNIISCDIPVNEKSKIKTPIFSSDSAYKFIKEQVDFGPRVPNTIAHQNCSKYLENKLKNFGADIIIQETVVEKYDGEKLKIKNIIGQFDIKKKKRILLFAHWDTRFLADQCTDSSLILKPIDGANDGASGVGVLLEIARQISQKSPDVGIDIIFFDAEDQGEPAYLNIMREKSWCLGSQYWSENLHKPNYNPKYGILLDMVGGEDAKFTKEDNSRHFAGYLTKEVWKIAQEIGYSEYFVNDYSKGIFHDHVFVFKNANIRSILIIEYHKDNPLGFGEFWHTHNDTTNIINKKTLKAVGQTVLEVIYRE